MQSLVSIEGYSPELKNYLMMHKWPNLMEALISGLVVMLPEDPWQFVIENLHTINSISNLQWDTFIDPDVLHSISLHHRDMLGLYNREGDTDLPSEELLTKASTFRQTKLFKLYFGAWIQYYQMKARKKELLQHELARARQFRYTKLKCLIVKKWHPHRYTVVKGIARARATAVLNGLLSKHLKRTKFTAWLLSTRESRKASLFFQNRGLGKKIRDENDEWYYPEGEDPLSLLPSNIAIQIFGGLAVQDLCRCAQVCRTWKDITDDTRLWNEIDLSPLGHFIEDSSLIHVVSKHRTILGHLNLKGCSLLTADSFKYIGQCQNLQDLNMSECGMIKDDAIKTIVVGCSGLFYLNLSYCYVTDSIIRILTKYCLSLNYLSLAYCTEFTDKGLQSIMASKGCRKLVYLDISGCQQLTPDAFHYIGQGCPILHTLVLDDITTLSDDAILDLCNYCHTLRHISLLGSASSLSDKAFRHLALENRKLKSIKIENNSLMTDISMRSFAKACRELQSIMIVGCTRLTDQGLKAIGSLRKLLILNIADCSRVSDAGVRYIIDGTSGSNLRELNVTNCAKLSDVTLLRMSQRCHKLQCLNMSYCEHITDTGVELLAQLPSLIDIDLTGCGLTDQGVSSLRLNPNLRHLGLAELPEVTDDGLEKMSQTLLTLETIDLSACENITDAGIRHLLYNCRLLRSIKLAACPRIGDTTAQYIAHSATYIQYIDLSGSLITDLALRSLKKGCQAIRQLDIWSCVNITKEAVVKFQKKCSVINYSTDPPQYNRHGNTNDNFDLPTESLINRI